MNRPQILTRFAVLLIGLTGILTASAQEPDSLLIDLDRALEIALSENPTVKVADMEITKKQYAQKSAYGALLPQLDVIGQYQRAIKRQTVYFDEGFGLGGGSIDPTQYTPEELEILKVLSKVMMPDPETSGKGFQMGRFNVWSAGLNVSLPVVVPSLWKNIQMSEVDIRLAMEKARASRIDLVNQVKKAFFSLMLAQDSYNVFKKTYETDSVNLENIRNRYNQGIVAEYDVITADVRLKSLIPGILQSENMMKIAELQLKMLMGVDGEMPLKVIGTLDEYEETMFNTMVEDTLEKAIARVDIEKMVEDKINSLDIAELEGMILDIASRELKHIELLGGVLGFLIGIIQGLLLLIIA